MADLGFVFLIGLLSSLHCVGMCGGFVLALGQIHQSGLHLRQALYFSGKTLTYAVFGAIAGAFGAAVLDTASGFQNVISVVLGVGLVVIGLSLTGVLRRFRIGDRLAEAAVLSKALGALLQRPNLRATFALGMVNGLLPCALVYGLLIKAASTGSAVDGALTMAVFGLATIPVLYLLGLSGKLIRPIWRQRLSRVAGALVIVMGLLTIARGFATTAPHHEHGEVRSSRFEVRGSTPFSWLSNLQPPTSNL